MKVDARECIDCFQTKPYDLENWPENLGKPTGLICRPCKRLRKKNFDRQARKARVAARTLPLSTLADTPPTPASVSSVPTPKESTAVELANRRLEIAKALTTGAAWINAKANELLEILFRYAASPTNPHHEWAMKLLAERLLPRKLYEDLGAQAAGLEAGAGAGRPSVTIIVQPATSPAPVDASPPALEGRAEIVVNPIEGK